MLCGSCHVHVRRDFPYCPRCGSLRRGAKVAAFEAPQLRWGSPESTVSLLAPVTTVGRDADNDVVIDDPSVSRHHARIVRDGAGFHVEDLGSFNGTAVTGADATERDVRGERADLSDQVVVHVGDVPVTFAQPRLAAMGSRTMVRGTEHTMLAAGTGADAEPAASEPLTARPRQRSGWALKRLPDAGGEQVWVLRNTRTGAYLSLDERDVFLWERLDGENTIRDLLFDYLEEYGELALPRIEATVRAFADVALVRGLPGDVDEASAWRRLGRAVVKNLIRVEITVRSLDPLVERLYGAFAWRAFTPAGVLAAWALTLAGLYAFWRAGASHRLFDVGGAGVVGAVAVVAGYVLATTAHELAHALAVKSYGRRVSRGGFLVMMGMPFAFVDTSDMWLGTAWSRIVVALSGPLTTTGVAGAASLGAAFVPDPRVAGVCYTVAFGLYTNTLFNLIPLLPLDGYQALADALRTPRLREEAREYFARGLWSDLAARRRPGPKQLGLVVFAVLSMICLYGFLALSILTWNSRIGTFLRAEVPQPWLTLVVVAVLAVIIFPVWFPRVRTLVRRVRARRAARTPAPPRPDHEEQAHWYA